MLQKFVIAVQGVTFAAGRHSSTLQLRTVLLLTAASGLEEQGLPPHADIQTERKKMPQRGVGIQVFFVQTPSEQVEICWIQENCPREVRASRSAASCKAGAADSSGGQTMLCISFHSEHSSGLELASSFGLTILFQLPASFCCFRINVGC